MIASTIGRTFLKVYNEKTGHNYNAKDFFIKEFVPLFYGGNKYMQWVINSPFVQGLSSAPKCEYGLREKIKGTDGKTLKFPSDSIAVNYFRENIKGSSVLLYCKLPKFQLTSKGKDFLRSLNLNHIEDFKKYFISDNSTLNSYCTINNETDTWKITDKLLDDIDKKKFNCKADALDFFTEYFTDRKGFFSLSNKDKVSSKGIEFIKTLNNEDRDKLLNDFINKVDKAVLQNNYEGSIAIGFPASETDSKTGKSNFAVASGQVTDIDFKYDENDIYFSWIGSGLGIGVSGAYTLFFNDPEILFSIFEGWSIYRKLISDNVIIHQGKQVDTWNGQWLSYRFDRYYNGNNDFISLQNSKVFKTNDDGTVSVDTVSWSKLMFKVSLTVSKNSILGYIGSISKTNKTLGFYQFQFSKTKSLIGYYKKLFGENVALDNSSKYENIFGLELKKACQLGIIGLQALEPSNLRDRYGNYATLNLTKPILKQKGNESDEDYGVRKSKAFQKDSDNIITYRTYKTWLLAMITKNKEESLEYTNEVAKALLAYREKAEKNDRKNLIQSELLVTTSKKKFINALVQIIEGVKKDISTNKATDEDLKIYKNLRDRVHMMSAEDFGYFVVLLKFDYAYEERNL